VDRADLRVQQEPANYVTKAAKEQWQRQKFSGVVIPRGAEGSFILKEEYSESASTKRKRNEPNLDILDTQSQPIVSEESQIPTSKRLRREESSPSTQSAQNSVPEVQDSYLQEDIFATTRQERRGSVAVEIALPEDFDRTVYQTVQSSQLGNTQEPPSPSARSLLEDPEDLIEELSSLERGPAAKRVAGRFVVPDSQDQIPASGSWEPTQDLKSTSTTDTSHFSTKLGIEEEDSLIPEIIQHDIFADAISLDSQKGGDQLNDSVDASFLEPVTSIIDFGILPGSISRSASSQAPSPQPASASTSPAQRTLPHPHSLSTRSLLTPTRQPRSSAIENSSTPSSQIFRESDRSSKANSSGQSTHQLLSSTGRSISKSPRDPSERYV